MTNRPTAPLRQIRYRAWLARIAEAVAYIGGSSKWSVSRRLICLGAVLEGLRTAHSCAAFGAGRRRGTYATASGRRDSDAPVRWLYGSARAAPRATAHGVDERESKRS